MKVFGKKKDKIVFYVLVCSLGLAGVLSFVTFACAPIGFEGQPLVNQASSASEEPNPVVTEIVTPSVTPVSIPSSTPTPTRVSTPTPAPTLVSTPADFCTGLEVSPQQFNFPARGGSVQILKVQGTPLGCLPRYECPSPGETYVGVTRVGYIPPYGYGAPFLSKIDWANFSWAGSFNEYICTVNVDINVSVDDNLGGPRSLTLEVRGFLKEQLKTIVINQAGI